MSWIEVQFLKKAVDVLVQCRQMLMFTYVFAFYLRKNNQSIIFEVRINCTKSFIITMEFIACIIMVDCFSYFQLQCQDLALIY